MWFLFPSSLYVIVNCYIHHILVNSFLYLPLSFKDSVFCGSYLLIFYPDHLTH